MFNYSGRLECFVGKYMHLVEHHTEALAPEKL